MNKREKHNQKRKEKAKTIKKELQRLKEWNTPKGKFIKSQIGMK